MFQALSTLLLKEKAADECVAWLWPDPMPVAQSLESHKLEENFFNQSPREVLFLGMLGAKNSLPPLIPLVH